MPQNTDIMLLSVLSDNYVAILTDTSTQTAVVIDPGEATPVIRFLDERGLTLAAIFCTHHHADHTDGNDQLVARYGCPVYGSVSEAALIPQCHHMLADGDVTHVGAWDVVAIATPGHTHGHMAFWVKEEKALFSGDSLFPLGCGRLFEGTAAEMWSSLHKLRDLPPDTRVYSGHEYTLANGRFALSIDPGNLALQHYISHARQCRAVGKPTIPVTMGTEREVNPFLRVDDKSFCESLGFAGMGAAEVFANLRRRKDTF